MEKGRGVRHLLYAELMERKRRGLCFRCGERYHPLHKCMTKSLSLLILGEGVESLDIAEEDLVAAMEVEQGTGEEKIECRIMGLLGFSTEEFQKCRTLRFEAVIHGAFVLVLVDSGVTHNFIAPQVVQSLGLKIDHSKRIPVKLGDGHRVFNGGKCSGVPLQVNDLTIVVEAFVLDLRGMDIILEVAWLQSLGKIIMDYREMTMSFTLQDKPVLLCGMNQEAREYNISDFQALSMTELKAETFREVEGWLWNTEVLPVVEKEKGL